MIGAHTGTRHLRMLVFQSCRLRRAFLAAALLVASAFCVHAKDWRGIVPLYSTRSDVERLLGKPSVDRSSTIFYEITGETVSFDFSEGGCTESNVWDVPRDTVFGIWVMPRRLKLKLGDLKLDLKRFKKVQDDHVLYIFHYIDEQEGVRYEVDESDGTVPLIHYFPAKKDERLRCPAAKTKGGCRRRRAMLLTPKFTRTAACRTQTGESHTRDDRFRFSTHALAARCIRRD